MDLDDEDELTQPSEQANHSQIVQIVNPLDNDVANPPDDDVAVLSERMGTVSVEPEDKSPSSNPMRSMHGMHPSTIHFVCLFMS